ncbi:MAG: siroheme synthase CysG [Gammaproteobacteria bacterium]|nr:siroheme synthase CysG [Gammaproteobacteria bacterium]
MDYLPLFASLAGQPCLLVGGGAVAERKVRQLCAAGARVTVNAPVLSAALEARAAAGEIAVARRHFDDTLVTRHLLVIAATDDRAVNHAVARAAAAAQRFCNVVDDPAVSTFISPSVVDRSPLIVAVSSGGRSPVLARLIRQWLEGQLPARLGALAQWAGRWRAAVRQRLPDAADRRRFWQTLLAGVPAPPVGIAADVLAGREHAADAALDAALDPARAHPPAAGEAWLVGAGPGDPELITLRGLRLLQQADVVLHDRLAAPALLDYARRDAEIINVGKTGGSPSTGQAAINALLVAHVRAGRRVCRLKGGDPYLFGRGGEEALALAAAGLPFQVVPGITAASGCGAYAGIPLTHRNRAHAVTFVTAHRAPGHEPDWAALAAADHTLVVYMAGQRLAGVAASLMAHGRAPDTPAAVIIAGTTASQRRIGGRLADIANRVAAEGAASPTLLYVGEVAGLDPALEWFEPAAGSPAPVHRTAREGASA